MNTPGFYPIPPTVYYLCRVKPTDKYSLCKYAIVNAETIGPFESYEQAKAEQKRLNAEVKKKK